MPWIRTIRVLPFLWIAWDENDRHEMNHKAIGFTEDQARNRTLGKLIAEDDDEATV